MRLSAKLPPGKLLMVLKTIPKKLILMSACSGSGMLELVSAALVEAINNMVLEKESLKMEVARLRGRDTWFSKVIGLS